MVVMLLSMLTVMEVSHFVTVFRLRFGVAYYSESFLLQFVDLLFSELTTSLIRWWRWNALASLFVLLSLLSFVFGFVLSAFVFSFLSFSVASFSLIRAVSPLFSSSSSLSRFLITFCSRLCWSIFRWFFGNWSIFLLDNCLIYLSSLFSNWLWLSFSRGRFNLRFCLRRYYFFLFNLSWLFLKDIIDNLLLVNRFVFDFFIAMLFNMRG